MRKLCPNFDREDGLETVLEVPVPEEMFTSKNGKHRRRNDNKMRFQLGRRPVPPTIGRSTGLQLLLGVIGAPLVPLPIPSHHAVSRSIKDDPIEVSMARYIVQQYIAATGGEKALDSISSMYAVGKVKMMASEFLTGSGSDTTTTTTTSTSFNGKRRKPAKIVEGEMGGFVLWQKKPEFWCLELVVSGCKISAGSDGKVAWRQTPWHQSHASRGPPRPLRRSLQGLDPRSTANLFSHAICIGEKAIDGEDCFVLRLDAEPSTLRARSSSSVELIRHTVWGYFSHRTGLLNQLEDSHLLRLKAESDDSVYWETTMESSIEDYRPIEGINIAHAGRTAVSLFRFGDSAHEHARSRMEETWSIEEVDFNIWGLSMDCFLPPGDLKKEQDSGCDVLMIRNGRPPLGVQAAIKMGSSKVAAVGIDDSDSNEED